MPYQKRDDLPDAVKSLPDHAQEIYMSAFNSALEQYGDESKAASTAWAAVKVKYQKSGDHWQVKESQSACRTQGSHTELREVARIEDGVSYPEAAYAYVPDPETPSAWKLRLREGAAPTRGQLAKASAALSPGGYNGQRADIPDSALPDVRRRIREAYRCLDVDESDIPRWVKEGDMSRTLLSEYLPLTEAQVSTKGRATITVIRPGLNATSQHFYPAQTLSRDCRVFEGVKMYADHPTSDQERARPVGSIRDWVATLQNVRVGNDGAIIGEAVVTEPWMKDKLALLRDQGLLNEMGVSIRAVGIGSEAEVDGTKTQLIERIVRARSVDFVTEPGAGGKVMLYESASAEDDVDLISVSQLRERRPDLARQIESDIRTQTQKEAKAMQETEQKIQELESQLEALTKERNTLQEQIAEADKARRVDQAQASIKEAVGKASLPEPAKVRLLREFAAAETTDGLEDAIKAEAEYVAHLTEAGRPKDMGRSAQPEDKDALKTAFMRAGMTDAQAEIAAKGR